MGAGSWGTAMASLLAGNCHTVLWARREELAKEISSSRRNPAYLSDFELPEGLEATSSLVDAVGAAEVVVMAVPSHGFRDVFSAAAPHLRHGVPVISLTKGLENHSLLRMTEIVREISPGHPAGVLTGPNLASEVIAGQPTASVLALKEDEVAWRLQQLFATEVLRVYTNRDVVGCEIAGALKNVIAIAAGIALGLGFGDNTRAALVTRGLAELGRLGTALGAESLTFGGLAGMGDLVATCTSPRSRNRHVGEELGKGRPIGEIVSEMSMVAEGVKSCGAVVELGSRHGVELPISEQVVAVIHEGRRPVEVIPALMRRRARSELDWISGPSEAQAGGAAAAGGGAPIPSTPAPGGARRLAGPDPGTPQPGEAVGAAGAGAGGSAAGGEDGTSADRLRAWLATRGVPVEEIEGAEAEGNLDLLAIDTLLVPRLPRFTPPEASKLSGLPLGQLHRMWRAMGFPDVPDEEAFFSDIDVEGFRIVQDLLVLNAASIDPAVQLMRVMGSAMSRVAEAEVTASAELVGVADRMQTAELFVGTADSTIPGIGRLLEYVWRRHLEIASHRVILREVTGGAVPALAVGFADLVGFTVLSQELDEASLARVIERFEVLAHEIVTSLGGRLVKMIGDEAMYVVEDPAAAARIGLNLSEAYGDDEIVSDVRVGIAAGPVIARDGDYYGPVVNLASRIVNIARPGSVLTSDEVHDALAGERELEWKPLRPRVLKDIGRVQLWSLRRPGHLFARRDERVWGRAGTAPRGSDRGASGAAPTKGWVARYLRRAFGSRAAGDERSASQRGEVARGDAGGRERRGSTSPGR